VLSSRFSNCTYKIVHMASKGCACVMLHYRASAEPSLASDESSLAAYIEVNGVRSKAESLGGSYRGMLAW